MIVKTGTDLSYYKYNNQNIKGDINLSQFVTTNDVTDMRYMFAYCSNIETVTSYEYKEDTYLYSYTESYTSTYIDDNIKYSYDNDYYYSYSYNYTSYFNQVNSGYVKNMNNMFANCYNLTTANLAYMNFSDCTDMSYMFKNCYNLTNVIFGRYIPHTLLHVNGIFAGCYNLSYVYVPYEIKEQYRNIFGQGTPHSYYYKYEWSIEDNLPITYAYNVISNIEEVERYTTLSINNIGAIILERHLYDEFDNLSLHINAGADCLFSYNLVIDKNHPTEYSDVVANVTYTTLLSNSFDFNVTISDGDNILKTLDFTIDNTQEDRYKNFDIYCIYVSDDVDVPSTVRTSYSTDWMFHDLRIVKTLDNKTLEYKYSYEGSFDDYDGSVIFNNRMTPPPGEFEELNISYVFAYEYTIQ